MARPAKTLLELVLCGGFRPGRYHPLLAGPDLPWPGLALLQQRYRLAAGEAERRQLAVEFLQAARLVRAAEVADTPRLAEELARLPGRPGRIRHVNAFFPAFLVHAKGPRAGGPFRPEPWQKRLL